MKQEPTISGNIITLYDMVHGEAMIYVIDNDISQYVIVGQQTNNLFSLSYPMRKQDHVKFAALIHRTNSENKLDKTKRFGYNPGPDDKPPRPTNPRGSGGKVIEAQNTFAVAA